MEEIAIKDIFSIRYMKLRFELVMTDDTHLPVNKVSALRGGLGEMLLKQNCVRNRNCDKCDFEPECLVRRTMYSKYEIKPALATGNDSIGYVLECENYEEFFPEGSKLIFYLILFGKTIVYFNQYLMAFYMLGMNGIGKYNSRFRIDKVLNEWQDTIVEGSNVYMQNYRIDMISNYIKFRMNIVKPGDVIVKFMSQASIKYMGEFQNEFYPAPVLASAARKIYMLDCFEGIEKDQLKLNEEELPQLVSQNAEKIAVKRYSSTSDSKMILRGIKGEMKLKGVSELCLKLLLAAELTHIGKNTSFGFGRIKVIGKK